MPSKACKNEKRRKELFTLELDPKLSHKKLTKKAHKNQIIPKKAKNKIPRERNEKKKTFFKKKLKKTIHTSNNHKIHTSHTPHKIFKKLQKRFSSHYTHHTLPKNDKNTSFYLGIRPKIKHTSHTTSAH